MRFSRSRVLSVLCGLCTCAAVNGVLLVAADAASAQPHPAYSLATVGAFGGEPSIASNSRGELFDTTPSGGTVMYRSADSGVSWTKTATADPSSGDDCVSTDQSDALYLCNLAGSPSTAPLQADVWKSVNDGNSWTYGNNQINQTAGSNLCGTSCNPF